MASSSSKPKKKKSRHKVPHGLAFVTSTFNNTIITITDPNGNVLVWFSAGSSGFNGSKKGTPYAAQTAAFQAGKEAVTSCSVKSIDVYVSGPGAGRESSIRALQASGLEVRSIRDVTPIPHNGCRPPKKRRV